MQITFSPSPGGAVLGPCPGCELWTLEYDMRDRSHEEWNEVVEDLLREHLDECRGLQEIVYDTL